MRQLSHVVRRLFSCVPAAEAAAAAAATAPPPGFPQIASAGFCSSAADSVVDCVVVGAGVIGLACARAAALAGLEVVVLEAEGAWGTGTSSRNSEVIHAGIYYPTGSLKARLCVEGKQRLYEFCRAKRIAHRQLGKLIVATDERQLPKLQQLQALAAANGVCDLQLLSGRDARELEPALAASAALLSPSSGILDSHGYMAALLADATAAGALLATHSRALGARQVPGTFPSCSATPSSEAGGGGAAADSPGSSSSKGHAPRRLLQLDVQDAASGEVSRLAARWLVNAAGLAAPGLAAAVAGLSSAHIPRQRLAKGSYFSLAGPGAAVTPFSRLVYPLPVEGGLGVHLTLDLAGAGRFGPDVQWVEAVDYSVEPGRAAAFYPEIRRYWPGLPDGSLQPSYCGIRPKLSGPGQPAADFWVAGPAGHGVPGLVNLFGMESPGLTASLALAEEVLRIMLPPHGATAH